MRLIPFPGHAPSPEELAEIAALEAALDGDGTGPEADYWRELRCEVRAMAAPMDPGFARALEQRVRLGSAEPERRARALPRWVADRRRRLAAGGTAALVVAATVLAAVLLAPAGHGPVPVAPATRASGSQVDHTYSEKGPTPVVAGTKEETAREKSPSVQGTVKSSANGASEAAVAPSLPEGGEAPGQASGRLQDLGASITLGAGSQGVQQVADRVGHLASASGGFVQSSRVQLQQGSPGEALMTLVLPSAKLAGVLAELERVAPVRAEAQSLQDVTSTYDAARARLVAARAERAALLRALAKATTPAAIESLHARIAQAGRQIAAAERARASISRRASQAEVEVTVLGQTSHGSGGLTLERGLHDAGHILTVALAGLLVAAAVLLPLALAVGALALATRYWRRQRRERVLGSG